jgi:hypothetical protein
MAQGPIEGGRIFADEADIVHEKDRDAPSRTSPSDQAPAYSAAERAASASARLFSTHRTERMDAS